MPDLNLDKLLVFLFFVTPGFFACRVFALWHPGDKKDWGSSLTEAISYSSVIFTVWFVWLMRLTRPQYAVEHPWEVLAAIIVVCFVSPVLLAGAAYYLRTQVLPRYGMDHPTRTGWDRFIRTHKHFFVLAQKKGGEMLGGLYAENSFASTYPVDPELYLQQLWRVDENGRFIEPVPGSLGTVIRAADFEFIEFFQVEVSTDATGDPTALRAAGPAVTLPPGGSAGKADPGSEQPNPSAAGGNGSVPATV
jgi:Family of unknown function (DUF6338)